MKKRLWGMILIISGIVITGCSSEQNKETTNSLVENEGAYFYVVVKNR